MSKEFVFYLFGFCFYFVLLTRYFHGGRGDRQVEVSEKLRRRVIEVLFGKFVFQKESPMGRFRRCSHRRRRRRRDYRFRDDVVSFRRSATVALAVVVIVVAVVELGDDGLQAVDGGVPM